MELSQFICGSLVQIARGIEMANRELKESSAMVNPQNVVPNRHDNVKVFGWLDEKKEILRAVHLVHFDVLVSATEGGENQGGAGISVAGLGFGLSKKSGQEQTAQNHIQFDVPVVLPHPAGS